MSRLKTAELSNLSQHELVQKLVEMRQEFFKLRLSAATSPVKSFPSQKRDLRKNIARVLTELHKSLSAEKYK